MYHTHSHMLAISAFLLYYVAVASLSASRYHVCVDSQVTSTKKRCETRNERRSFYARLWMPDDIVSILSPQLMPALLIPINAKPVHRTAVVSAILYPSIESGGGW